MIIWKTYLGVCKEHFKKSQTDFDLTPKIPPRSEQLKIKISHPWLFKNTLAMAVAEVVAAASEIAWFCASGGSMRAHPPLVQMEFYMVTHCLDGLGFREPCSYSLIRKGRV